MIDTAHQGVYNIASSAKNNDSQSAFFKASTLPLITRYASYAPNALIEPVSSLAVLGGTQEDLFNKGIRRLMGVAL